MDEIKKSTKKERIGWYIYDWANSAFSTTVVTVFIGPYLTKIVSRAADANGYIHLLGFPIYADSYFPYLISLSVLFQLLLLPIIGAAADLYKMKKIFLGGFALIGSIATMFMYFLQGDSYLLGGFLFVLANFCFGASMVMYNAYLSDIAEEEWRDQISSIGWGIGYLGGGVLLLLNLLLFTNAENIFAENATEYAIRISLCSAGVWWLIFTIFPMMWLRTRRYLEPVSTLNPIKLSYRRLKETLSSLKKEKNALMFLLAFIFYNDGVQAVITLSSQFGSRELGLSSDVLVSAILMVQFVAFFGAFIFKYLAKVFGNRNTILLLIGLWCLAVIYAYSVLNSASEFFILAAVIAIAMGGIQALSRSLYSQLIPQDRAAEYFSIYELSEKGSSLLGPLAFGLAMQFTQSYRFGILSLIIFFIVGFIILIKVKTKRVVNR